MILESKERVEIEFKTIDIFKKRVCCVCESKNLLIALFFIAS